MSYNGAGCDYNNKYEIPTYGSEPSDSIRIQVRHYQDSYIAAEEATKGCSSENINEKTCIRISSTTSETKSKSVSTYYNALSKKVQVTNKYRTAVLLVCVSLTSTLNIVILKIIGYIGLCWD